MIMGNAKKFNGKAIYCPSGKAAEYSYWACNFYVGCSNDCSYCYCKNGALGKLWSTTPRLKKCFKDEEDAMRIFKKELLQNIEELREHGLFFTFTTDPMIDETYELHWEAIYFALDNDVPVKILTKSVGAWVDQLCTVVHPSWRDLLAIGFTLTGFDSYEPHASSNVDRMLAMQDLKSVGYKVFASIEPIIDPRHSLAIIMYTYNFCDLFKIGLLSDNTYTDEEINNMKRLFDCIKGLKRTKFYLKDSFVKLLDIDRESLPDNFVGRDYNIFKS